jgi:hypothetical protein
MTLTNNEDDINIDLGKELANNADMEDVTASKFQDEEGAIDPSEMNEGVGNSDQQRHKFMSSQLMTTA